MNCYLLKTLGIIFVFTFGLFAQEGTIKGRVTDSQTGEALIGANIVLQGTSLGAATDTDGIYEITEVSADTYSVEISYIGYEDVVLTNVIVDSGQSITLDAQLEPTGVGLNAVIVSASRRPEKVLDAPADVVVLDVHTIETRPTLTVTEHLKTQPAVDVASNGIVQSNVVVRGFNNIFSGALLTLVDNRIARVPSLRVNVYNFISTPSEDLERIEIVLGPGAALYGPNSANGVFHMVTKSPFGSEGTTISIGGGERSVLMGTLRHAGSFNSKVGYKITGTYYQGNDFESTDPVEVQNRQEAIDEGADPDTLKIGKRDFDVDKLAFEARLDYHISPDATFILNGGYSRASQIEQTGIGAGQAIDWSYVYAQARLTIKDLFMQAFLNRSDAGDTFLLRSGNPIVDHSTLFVSQIQHSLLLGTRQRFTYGADLLLTRPGHRRHCKWH